MAYPAKGRSSADSAKKMRVRTSKLRGQQEEEVVLLLLLSGDEVLLLLEEAERLS